MKSFALIGHRGVGKSSVLAEIAKNFSNHSTISLDSAIEEDQGQSIKEIFSNQGEAKFREIEIRVFKKLLEKASQQPMVVDVGAGFLGEIPKSLTCIWLKRKSHSAQSLYLNRPNLDVGLAMTAERFAERESRYQQRADLTVELREGPKHFNIGEKLLFAALLEEKSGDWLRGYYYTLSPQTTELEKTLLLRLGVDGFEYRDDLLSSRPVELQRDLFSFRSLDKRQEDYVGRFDWPLEWGSQSKATVLSMHSKTSSIQEIIGDLPETDQVIKLALPVDNFAELKAGHDWARGNPERRAFLPMSKQGRWNWYRRLTASQTPVKFLRWHQGSATDQPSVLEVLNDPLQSRSFAAVLGSPVSHSWTPTNHQNYFAQRNAPVFAIDVSEDEWDEALPFLQDLGLRWAAVTSPLKNKAAEWAKQRTAINTLCFSQKKWIGTNTDEWGLRELLAGSETDTIAVWGGGGTHASIMSVAPKAVFYSSRTGEQKNGSQSKVPTALIWAVGAKLFRQQGVFPPEDWPIQTIFDLNYTSDSPGIECAWNMGCQYRSGVVMFEAQALKQQEFWNECRVE